MISIITSQEKIVRLTFLIMKDYLNQIINLRVNKWTFYGTLRQNRDGLIYQI